MASYQASLRRISLHLSTAISHSFPSWEKHYKHGGVSFSEPITTNDLSVPGCWANLRGPSYYPHSYRLVVGHNVLSIARGPKMNPAFLVLEIVRLRQFVDVTRHCCNIKLEQDNSINSSKLLEVSLYFSFVEILLIQSP